MLYLKNNLRMLKQDLHMLSGVLADGSAAKGCVDCAMNHVQDIEKELDDEQSISTTG